MDMKCAVSILSLAFVLSIRAESATPSKSVNEAYNEVKQKTGSQLLTEVVFQQGKSDLTPDAMQSLREMLYNATKKGKIAEVEVASWADKEYPPRDVGKLSRDDRRLADDRLASIKNFIADNASGQTVRTFNMAEQPDALEKLLKTSPNVKVKQSLEAAGVAHPNRSGMPAKASHALVMVTLR